MQLFWKYVSVLTWLSYLLITSVLLFSKGFLLSRQIINSESECSTEPESWFTFDGYDKDAVIYHQPCVNSNYKVIIILIDALRFDFVKKVESNIKSYHNKLTVIHELMEDRNRTRLYQFIADPPTTTMQRLHGLMTGSLPTFIDVGSNFASSEIFEDNLIRQIVKRKKRIVFLGDDTWTHLFPRKFMRTFAFPSFNVWDLDTVDKGINSEIFNEIQKNDWDLLIGHYLGVDHCGHRYGPNHPEMVRKLNEMNNVIKNITNKMDNNTFLFVFGDHGMTEYGDHGGASEDETNAALFIKSPLDLVEDATRQNIVRQIDLLPTLAEILGVAIPFSNLGSLIVDSLPSFSRDNQVSSNVLNLLPLVKRNADQVTLYLKKYSLGKSHFSEKSLINVFKQYQLFLDRISQEEPVPDHLQTLNSGKDYLSSVRIMCEQVWAQFNFKAIHTGLFLFIVAIFVVSTSSAKVSDEFNKRISKKFTFSFLTCLTFSVLLTLVVHLITSADFEILFYSFSVCSSLIHFILFFKKFSVPISPHEIKEHQVNFLCCLLFFLAVIGLFSNSYIVSENGLVSFLMITVIWITFLRIVLKKKKVLDNNLKGGSKFFLFKNYFLLFLSFILSLIVRGSHYFWQCYDEGSGNCQVFKISSLYSNVFAIIFFNYFKKYLSLLMLELGVKCGSSWLSKFFKILPNLCFILLSIYWIQDCFRTLKIFSLSSMWIVHLLPQTVGVLSLLGIIMLYMCPLLIFVDNFKFSPEKMFLLRSKNKQLCVNNLGTIYSSVFLLLVMLISIFGVVLLGEKRSLSCFMLFLTIAGLLVLLSLLKLSNMSNQSQMLHVTWWEVSAWQVSSLVNFYGTGHQATFSSLQWDSVVIFGDNIPLFVPGILILLNTFISQIVHALLLPLLLFAPFTVSHILSKTATLDDGEFILFKKKNLRRQLLYSLITKNIVLQSVRVFGIMLSCTIHSRHLMVWKIFAPKFVFEGVGLMISLPALILGFVLVERISQQIQLYKKNNNFEIIFQ